MPLLGVNIDHVATVRQARYRDSGGGEPDIVEAAREAVAGGADIITVHLREDRRHINDRDLERLLADRPAHPINLEMGATAEMHAIALRSRAAAPHLKMCTLVPEGRQEVTTEGGLDVAGQTARLRDYVAGLKARGLRASAFIDPDIAQVHAAADAGFDACELHTGQYAGAFATAAAAAELARLRDAAAQIVHRGMQFNAGHALNYLNIGPVAALPKLAELHIGHSIVSRALFSGLRQAVAEMKQLSATGPTRAGR